MLGRVKRCISPRQKRNEGILTIVAQGNADADRYRDRATIANIKQISSHPFQQTLSHQSSAGGVGV